MDIFMRTRLVYPSQFSFDAIILSSQKFIMLLLLVWLLILTNIHAGTDIDRVERIEKFFFVAVEASGTRLCLLLVTVC